MRNQKGVSLIALIITIIVMIILAAIVMSSGGNTISQANYASFAQQFGEYADQVKIDAATVMAETGKNGKSINEAQKFHMVATGETDLASGDKKGAYGFQLPVGYVVPSAVQEALGFWDTNGTGASGENQIVAYLIDDNEINGYENKNDLNFYGDSNGKEHHFVTSDGTVFTLPGFQEEQEDGSIKYYVTSQGHYYTVKGKDAGKTVKVLASFNETGAIEADPVLVRDLKLVYGVDSDGKPHGNTSGAAGTASDADAYSRFTIAAEEGLNYTLTVSEKTTSTF